MPLTQLSLSPPSPSRQRGFSLVEMVISLAVISILLVGMTSAIVLASRALPSSDGPAAATVQSAQALHQLRDELRAATQLLNRDAKSVTLHLPDRDADGQPEVITYAWAGSPGDPLTRAANGNAAVAVLGDVARFTLMYDTNDDDQTVFQGPPGTTSSEQLLSSFTTRGDDDHELKDDEWIGTKITPDLPAGATTWQVSRALFYGRQRGGNGRQGGGTDSTITFELRGWNGNEPGNTVLDTVDLAESELGNQWAWQEAVFPGDVTFDANENASVVLANYGGGEAGRWEFHDEGSSPTSMFTGDGEGGWSEANDDEELPHYVYGFYQRPTDDWTYTRPRIAAVKIELTHNQADIAHAFTVSLPNAPEAANALWEADFNADPTAFDANDDGITDWQDEGIFDAGNLNAGRWDATNTLRSAPDRAALDLPFVLDVWLEDTLDNGENGGVLLWFDRKNGGHACVNVEVDRTGGNQQVAIMHEAEADSTIRWVSVTRPSGAAVHVSLMVDTINDAVGVLIDGDHAGSFAYSKTPSSSDTVLSPYVTAGNSGTVLRHLRLSTGGNVAITPGAYDDGTSGSAGSDDSGSGDNLDLQDVIDALNKPEFEEWIDSNFWDRFFP